MTDELVTDCVVYINICRAKLLGRISALRIAETDKPRIRDDIERFERARDYLTASLTYLEQTRFAPSEVQLQLPWTER